MNLQNRDSQTQKSHRLIRVLLEENETVADRRDSQGIWDEHVHSVVFKMDNQQDLLIAHGTLLNVLWKPGWEGSFGENGYVYVYGRVPLLCTLNYHTLLTGNIPI